MTATQSVDFQYEPRVWQDHITAFFNEKLVFGATAYRDNTLQTSPGLTVTFPYFTPIGDAEEPLETEGLQVDSIADDSFTATVKEVGKAVGIKKKAFKKSAASTDRIIEEVSMQLGRRMAEKVDTDLLNEFSGVGNFINGFTPTLAAQVMTVKRIAEAKIMAFGDRQNEAGFIHMHSRQYLDLLRDDHFAALKAENDFYVEGSIGRILGMIVIVNDRIPASSVVDGRPTYRAFMHKANAYGLHMKQEIEIETDYDILHREWVFTANQWYAVKSLHAKVNSGDLRTAEIITTVGA